MPSSSVTETPSTSGITTSSTGERHIPSSTRADGTVRREIRVRPGYRPPEDVEVYKNRAAEARKSRGKGGVPGAEFTGDEQPKQRKSKSGKRSGKTADSSIPTPKAEEEAQPSANAHLSNEEMKVDSEAEREKEARKLTKKLRQARELQQRKDKGDTLLPEQFEKVIRINELIRQLDSLGFDIDGHQKIPA